MVLASAGHRSAAVCSLSSRQKQFTAPFPSAPQFIEEIKFDVIILGMDPNQTRIIELLREIHLIAFKEFERLNLRIAELESLSRRQPEAVVTEEPAKPPFTPMRSEVEMMNERQVADHLNMSVGVVRKWRLFRKGPRFVKIGRAIRYRHQDVAEWLDSCHGLS